MYFRVLLGVVAVAGLLAGGCGSKDEPAPEPVERKKETADKLPKLERGYEEFVNAERASPSAARRAGAPRRRVR